MSARHENTKCHPDQQCREPGEEGEGRGEQEQAGQGDREQEQAGFFLHFHLLKDDGDDAGEQAGQGDQDRD